MPRRESNLVYWAIGAVALLILGTGGVVVYKATRGLRNNNPGNIRHGSAQWQGMAETQKDPAFVQFVAPEWGIRAIAKTLKTYRDKYGLTTIRGIISRWAPPSDNNPTEAYINNVANHAGIDAGKTISWQNDLPRIVEGIIAQENGIQPYSVDTINKGISLA